MDFRYARHTNNLEALTAFYTNVIGMERLGGFEGHANYNGVFLGFPNADWHLEFTSSEGQASQVTDEDDLLVFYLSSKEELKAILKSAEQGGINPVRSKNPYWQVHGVQINDPDGFGVILSVKEEPLQSKDKLTELVRGKDIDTWGAFLSYIRELPYGRTSNRTDMGLVLKENKGTCSSKHALAKTIADANEIKGVELILGIYKMNGENTNGVGAVMAEYGLDYIPEAHCYIKVNGKRLDLTNPASSFLNIKQDVLQERPIEPADTGAFKQAFHKAFLQNWVKDPAIGYSADQVWSIREECIRALQQ